MTVELKFVILTIMFNNLENFQSMYLIWQIALFFWPVGIEFAKYIATENKYAYLKITNVISANL